MLFPVRDASTEAKGRHLRRSRHGCHPILIPYIAKILLQPTVRRKSFHTSISLHERIRRRAGRRFFSLPGLRTFNQSYFPAKSAADDELFFYQAQFGGSVPQEGVPERARERGAAALFFFANLWLLGLADVAYGHFSPRPYSRQGGPRGPRGRDLASVWVMGREAPALVPESLFVGGAKPRGISRLRFSSRFCSGANSPRNHHPERKASGSLAKKRKKLEPKFCIAFQRGELSLARSALNCGKGFVRVPIEPGGPVGFGEPAKRLNSFDRSRIT